MTEIGPKEPTISDQQLGPKQPQDLVEKYSAIKDTLDLDPLTVYHPCGGLDCSPSAVFPSSRVIYVDQSKESMAKLRQAGYEAYSDNANQFDPGEVDLLILLNPAISSSVPASYVAEQGYVISNNYNSNASELYEDPEFDLRGSLYQNEDGSYSLDQDNAYRYWEEGLVDEEEDLVKHATFDTFYKPIVDKYGDPSRGYLSEFMRLRQEIAGSSGVGMHDGEVVVFADLPHKVTPSTGLFVFQRKKRDA